MIKLDETDLINWIKAQEAFNQNVAQRLAALEKPTSEVKLKLHYKLTLPINKDGGFTGSALEIPYSKLIAGYSSEFYKVLPNGDKEFYCPANGATTDNASYPRTEERLFLADPNKPDEMINIDRGGILWKFDQDYTITELNAKGKVVILQSHAVEAPPDFKVVVYGDGQIKVLGKMTDASKTDDGLIDLTENKTKPIKVGTKFNLSGSYDGKTLNIALNKGKVFTLDYSKKKTKWYPKIGCYIAAFFAVRMIVHKAN